MDALRAVLLASMALSWAAAQNISREFHVSLGGSDSNPGNQVRPFATIRKCAEALSAGDVCLVHEGTYRETVTLRRSGRPGKPIRFAAYPGEIPVVNGAEFVKATWTRHKGSIYRAKVNTTFVQLFADGKMMVEARWPNMRFDQLWDRSRWARAGKGSRYGKMVDPELAKTGVDWRGSIATLNVAHQFLTWTRLVTVFDAGNTTFEYNRDLPTITNYADRTAEWEDDRYYLSGKLEALDSPGEWFLDTETKTLYVWLDGGDDPSSHRLEAKARDYGFDGSGVEWIEIEGFHFFAASFRFEKAHRVSMESCHLRFPTYARELTDLGAPAMPTAATLIRGDDNTIRNSSLAYSSTGGFTMVGARNRIENCLVHDICWNGSLRYVGIDLGAAVERPGGEPSIIRGNTVLRTGNASINYRGQRYFIEYNHAYQGGLACKDVALIYTGMPYIAGSVVHHNWAHGCRTEEGRGGLGIRGDDQTRELTVHHNVVWDTGRDGIIVKGDNNRVYHNTVFNIGTPDWTGNYISLHTEPEPVKPWRMQFPLLKQQNAASHIVNNAARTISGDRKGGPFPAGPNVGNNFTGQYLGLADPDRLDFRPRAGSPLIDAGRVIPGINDGYQGVAPDVGAYEFGGEQWVAGYRNHIRVHPTPVKVNSDGEGWFDFSFLMPLLEPTTVSIKGTGGVSVPADKGSIRIAENEWMQQQRVKFRLRGDTGTIRLEVPGAKMVQIEVHR